jgi:hypothetical protein
MSNFHARGHTYQATKTFAQVSFVTVVAVVSAVTVVTLVFCWFVF